MDFKKYKYTLDHPELSVDEKRISLVKNALKDFELEGIDSNLLIAYLVEFVCDYTYFLKEKLDPSKDVDVRKDFFEENGIEEEEEVIEENSEEEDLEEFLNGKLTAYDVFQVVKITIEHDRIEQKEIDNF